MPKVVFFHKHGGPEVLSIEEIDVPAPAREEVRIRVKALGINRAEALMRAGHYIERPGLPARLGLEAAGIVDMVGEGVEGVVPGQAVSVIPPISMAEYPAYGELALFPRRHIVSHPSLLGWEEAAALWMPFLTAYGALVDIAGLRKGEAIGITAASSSVGLAAIQIANLLGAIPIAITRGSAKKQKLLDAGAAHVVCCDQGSIEERLREAAGPNGIRVVLDAVGGPLVSALAEAMSIGGTLFSYGRLNPEPTLFPQETALAKSLLIRGYLVHEIVRDGERLARAKAFIVDGVNSGALRPVVARIFPFDEIVQAHRFLESGDQFGKIVVRL